MNFSRQALLGVGMIIGGSVMLYAMVQQIGAGNAPAPVPAIVDKSPTEPTSSQPLTIDIDTEKRILAQKQKERAARVAEQEKRAQLFLAEQETAEAQALAKSRAENQQYIANAAPAGGESDSPEAAQKAVTTPKVQPRTDTADASTVSTATTNTQKETARQVEIKQLAERKQQAEADAKRQVAAKEQSEARAAAQKRQAEEKAANEAAKNAPPKSSSSYTVKSGDGLLRLSRQYNIPVEALAQANDMSPSAALQLGQTLTLPSRKQIERLEREAVNANQARENQRQKEEALSKKSADAKRDAQQKLREARQEVKETDAKGSFGVQVALANDQASADNMAKKFKAAGYQVKTSNTSRGVRVIVGPERGKVAALALKDKINSDPKVNTTSAWVLYWR